MYSMMSIEELVVALEGYPNGAFLYHKDVDGIRYYHFERWIATEELIRTEFVKRTEDGSYIIY